MAKTQKIIQGEIVDDSIIYSLTDVCEICGAPQEIIIELVEYGVLEPVPIKTPGKTKSKTKELMFSQKQLLRSQQALRLQRDLSINLQGIALVLQLMDELEDLKTKTVSPPSRG